MAVKKKPNGVETLKKDLHAGNPGRLYLLYGEEDYLKKHYLEELKTTLVDETFAEFNLVLLEGRGLTPEMLSEAVESYPAFAERKLVVVNDFDLYKPHKRTKMHALLDKTACFAEFTHLDERELIAWVRRRVRALGKDMDQDTCAYLIFLCGTSMTNLITEIEKAAAHCTLDEIKRYNIDAVCTRVLDAVIFDLTDAITARRFDKAVVIVGDLLAQKNTEVAIFSAILRHVQRLYAAKLSAQSNGSSNELSALVGSGSSFYAQKLKSAARSVRLEWLRSAVQICGETDAALKSSAADKQKILELALLQMASNFEGTA